MEIEQRIIKLEQHQKQIEEKYEKLFHFLGNIIKTNCEQIDISIEISQAILSVISKHLTKEI